MKLKLSIACGLALFYAKVHSQGFPPNHINWALPPGGHNSPAHNYGFHNIAETGNSELGFDSYTTMDINGDGLPDVIVTATGDGNYQDGFGVGTNPHWKVYLNTGSGMSTTATIWSLPAGGHNSPAHNYGFHNIAETGNTELGFDSYTTMDINGDGLPDLIVTATGDGSYQNGFGVGTNPYWKVYLNTGTGMSTTAINWTLPAGGHNIPTHNYGFHSIAETGSSELGFDSYTTMDINGDAKPDLVVTATGDGTYQNGFGVGTNPYWKVYLNTGTGMSTTAINWTLPAGGHNTPTHNYGFHTTAETGTSELGFDSYTTIDINGDAKPDLVVTATGDGTYQNSFDVGTNPYWKVYLNTGSGMATTAINWSLPAGGHNTPAHNYGFHSIAETGTTELGFDSYTVMDMNGDGIIDLLKTATGDGSYQNSYDVGNNPYWKVYLSSGITGIAEEKNHENISVYPNPNNGNFKVFIADVNTEQTHFVITNILGEKIKEGYVGFGANEIKINAPKGTYILTVTELDKMNSTRVVLY